jgi:hypothetical protein
MPGRQRLRTVIHESRFTRELKALEPKLERSEEFLDGIEWVLARNPGAGTRIRSSAVWSLAASFADGTPVIVYYTASVHTVSLLSIEIYVPPER